MDRLLAQDVCDLGALLGAQRDEIGYTTDWNYLRVGVMSYNPSHCVRRQDLENKKPVRCTEDFAIMGHTRVNIQAGIQAANCILLANSHCF